MNQSNKSDSQVQTDQVLSRGDTGSGEGGTRMGGAAFQRAVLQRKLLQRRASRAAKATDPADLHAIAAEGVSGNGGGLPHGAAIQHAFGDHDVSGVRAHVGGQAADAAGRMGAEAYATGDSVAFARSPDLHTAAHEAAHVVQQRTGVHLPGGVGQVGDAYEQHADQVADRVVQGKSATDLLSPQSGGAGGGAVQHKAVQCSPDPGAGGAGGANQSGGAEGAGGAPAKDVATGGQKKTFKIEFAAFIPSWKGKPLTAHKQPKGLKNQAAFDASLAAITSPANWLPEPGQINPWANYFCSSDDRGFGGGSHRLHSIGTVTYAPGQNLSASLTHDCSPSHRVITRESMGIVGGKEGSVEGPLEKTAGATGSESYPTTTSMTFLASAGYPFVAVSPNIDYKINLRIVPKGDDIEVIVDGKHNQFPCYELLVNGASQYTYSAADAGPGVWNLNTSTTFTKTFSPG